MVRSEQTGHVWRIAGISIAGLLLLTLILYRQTLLYLIGLWNELEVGLYSHGYLVLIISAYLLARNRRTLASLVPRPCFWALPAVAAASLLWFVAAMTDVNVIQAAGLLLLLQAIVWAVFGNQVALALLFPVFFLIFAIPVWFPLSPLLQSLTADVVYSMIRVFEIPALRHDNTIVLESGKFFIDEACGGLRYLLVALTLGSVYAYLNYNSLAARLVVVLASGVAAIAANLLRVFIVVYVGYATDMKHPLVHDHLMLGWYLFGGLVLILLIVEACIQRFDKRARPMVAPNDEPTSSAAPKVGWNQFIGITAAVASVVAAAPLVISQLDSQQRKQNMAVEIELPGSVDGWRAMNASDDDWRPLYHGAIDLQQIYEQDNEKLILYVGYYPIQRQDEELINELNRITNDEVWRASYPNARLTQLHNHQSLEQLLEKPGGEKRLVWYWYQVAGRITTSKYIAKLLQVLGQVTGNQQAYVVAVAVDFEENPEDARRLLVDFVLKLPPMLKGEER